MTNESSTQQLRDMRLSDGRFPGYAFPGGYEIHYIMADCGVLCHQCANRENGSEAYIGTDPSGELGDDPQWHIVDHNCHWEGEPITCDHCNREIESEYGDPDAEDEETAETLHCDGCQMLSVNGIACHETGCPEAWKAREVACFECGCDFQPESRHQRTCDDCLNPESDD